MVSTPLHWFGLGVSLSRNGRQGDVYYMCVLLLALCSHIEERSAVWCNMFRSLAYHTRVACSLWCMNEIHLMGVFWWTISWVTVPAIDCGWMGTIAFTTRFQCIIYSTINHKLHDPRILYGWMLVCEETSGTYFSIQEHFDTRRLPDAIGHLRDIYVRLLCL